jgi:hypothetical protein
MENPKATGNSGSPKNTEDPRQLSVGMGTDGRILRAHSCSFASYICAQPTCSMLHKHYRTSLPEMFALSRQACLVDIVTTAIRRVWMCCNPQPTGKHNRVLKSKSSSNILQESFHKQQESALSLCFRVQKEMVQAHPSSQGIPQGDQWFGNPRDSPSGIMVQIYPKRQHTVYRRCGKAQREGNKGLIYKQ